jgi:TATA-box binding protein (TBP) (component of TFIID and TFIIIB)
MDIELVNVVAGGSLDIEIDLHSAFEQIGASNAKYEPEIAPGLQLQLKGATIMLFHKGEYHLTGADSFENAQEAARKLTEVLEKVLEEEVQQEHSEIRNLLYKKESSESNWISKSYTLISQGKQSTIQRTIQPFISDQICMRAC